MFRSTDTRTATTAGALGRPAGAAGRIVHAVLGAGLICTLAPAMVFISAAPAHAATSPFYRVQAALARVRSYEVKLTITTLGATATTATTATVKGTLVAVRTPTGLQIHVRLVTSVGGQSTPIDGVIVGSKVCVQVTPGQPYQCASSPALARQLNVDPLKGVGGASTPVTPVAGKNGCAGYAFDVVTTRAGSTTTGTGTLRARTRGTLYVAPTDLPCELDAMTTATTSGKTLSVKTVATWSRFGDPSLSIPKAP